MVNDGLPPNISARSEPATIPDSVPRFARWAAPTSTAADPNAFDSFTRTRRPPMLVRRIIRTVWLVSDVTVNGVAPRPPTGVCTAGDGAGGGVCAGVAAVDGIGVAVLEGVGVGGVAAGPAPRAPAGGVVRINCWAVPHVGTQLSDFLDPF